MSSATAAVRAVSASLRALSASLLAALSSSRRVLASFDASSLTLYTASSRSFSAALAASLAAEAGAERLVLTHLNPLVSPRLLLREAQALHPCVALASPGAVLDV